jgi:hypothetical protein
MSMAVFDVLSRVARQGAVYRADLPTDEQRAAAYLVKVGRLAQRDEIAEGRHGGRFVIYYDPDWQPPTDTGLRLVK